MEYRLIAERQQGVTFLEQILLNRGIKKEDIQHFLNVNENDNLNPLLLEHMRDGAQLLAKHISLNSNVLTIIDADCDGFCSSAIFMNYLNNLFPSWVQNNIYYKTHEGKEHGLNDLDFAWCVEYNIKLVVCPDSASNDYKEHARLKELGIDCLILDHHQTDGGYSNDAITINNQLCDYPTKSLCGGAIVYKFCQYFDTLMSSHFANEYLDLVSLSLIADMMDGRDFETHYLIQEGLQRIKNPFFVEMMNRQRYQFESGITPIGIAFYIVPYINAMTRSGTMEEKILMFEAMLEWRSNELIPSTKRGCKGQVEPRHEQAGRTCVNVKSRQKKVQDEGLAYIENIIEEQNLLDNKMLIVRVPEEAIDKNLAGLVANQLANKYARPTLVLRIFTDENGQVTYSGSGRNYSRSRLDNLRQLVLDTGYASFAQGHNQAFGCSITADNFDNFLAKTNEELADFDFSPCYNVDLEVSEQELTEQEVFAIGSNNDIWGQGLEEPLIAITNIRITSDNIALLGQNKNTLKITLPNKDISMIKFNIKEEDKELLDPGQGTLTITAIGKCSLNHYMGNVTPQVLLEDFEIVRKNQWDF